MHVGLNHVGRLDDHSQQAPGQALTGEKEMRERRKIKEKRGMYFEGWNGGMISSYQKWAGSC